MNLQHVKLPDPLVRMKKIFFFVLFFLGVLALLLIYQKNSPVKKSQPNIVSKYSTDQMWGKEAREMFPPITSPKYETNISKVDFLKDNSVVYTFEQNGTKYIYPAQILGYHHLVNDTIDGKPLLISLCLLTETGLVYSRQLDDQVLTFGILGTLYYGNLVMFDNQTNSYWIQLLGESFQGNLQEKKLKLISPLTKTYWAKIKNLDNLKVLLPEKDLKFYDEFYNKYKTSPLGLQALKVKKDSDTKLPDFTEGFGVKIGNEAKFYPKGLFDTKSEIQDKMGGKDFLLTKGSFDEIISSDTNLELIPSYWFSWSAFYPKTQIY